MAANEQASDPSANLASMEGSGGFFKLPGASYFQGAARGLNRKVLAIGLIVALLCALSFVALDLYSAIPPVLLAAVLVCPVLFWHYPRAALYIIFVATCLVEVYGTYYPDEITGKIYFFYNINTVMSQYVRGFEALPLNVLELILIILFAFSFIKVCIEKNFSFEFTAISKAILVYISFVAFFFIYGILNGSDFKVALQETRAQFYFFVAYCMGAQFIKDRKQVNTLLWIMAIGIAIKGVLYTFRRYVTLGGMPLPDGGVGSHEEAFFFGCLSILPIVLLACNTHRKLMITIWCLMPIIVTGNMATNRRAGTAGMIIALVCLLLSAYRAFPARRKGIATLGIVLGLVWSVYYPLFRNSPSMFALPARAVKSQFQPDYRDQMSNQYRDAENACLMATIRSAPLGYGYGKPMLHAVPIADISKYYEWWDILPHNQILWVWMRIGTPGFIVFWIMIACILVRIAKILRSPLADNFDKMVTLYTLTILVQLLMFGLVDLQLSNYRDMLFAGFWIGITDRMIGSRLLTPVNELSEDAQQLRRSQGIA
jgi:O-antigen ligase